LVKFVHIIYIYIYIHEKLKQKSDVLKKLYVFLVTYCKIFHPKSPFYEKVKMTTKRIVVIESFIIISSFDCDCAQYLYACLFWCKSILQWISLDLTKAKKNWSDTYYYLKPICKLEISTKHWIQINETNFLCLLLSNYYTMNINFQQNMDFAI